MKKLNLDKVKTKDFVNGDVLVRKFQEYLMKNLDYSEVEAQIASSDMKNPYTAPYVFQDAIAVMDIEGTQYEVRFCHTNFTYCGIYCPENIKPFEFYVFYDRSTIKNNIGAEYIAAKKFFIV